MVFTGIEAQAASSSNNLDLPAVSTEKNHRLPFWVPVFDV